MFDNIRSNLLGVMNTRKNPIIREALEWIVHIGFAVIVGLTIVTFIAQITIVYGNSMQPTLQPYNFLVVEKLTPRFGELKAGDIVTLNVPEYVGKEKSTIVKRVIAVEGDVFEIKNGMVYVNNKALEEGYIMGSYTQEVNPQYAALVIPEDHIYVLGDNRLPNASLDSRSIGAIAKGKIGGKVILRIFPFNEFGKIY